ncbi:MAG: hypothetical protein WCT85_06655, partial [Parachlamydiales bacterium]
IASDPFIQINSAGEAIVIWKEFNWINNYIVESNSSNNITNWTTPINLSGENLDVLEHKIIPNGSDVIIVFSKFNGFHLIINEVHSFNNLNNWSSPINLSDPDYDSCCPGIISISGEALVVWKISNAIGDNLQITQSSNGLQNWTVPKNLDNLEGVFYTPTICLINNTEALLAWRKAEENNLIVQCSYSSDGLQNWSNPINLSDSGTDSFENNLSSDNNANIIAYWIKYINSKLIFQLRHSM